MSLIETHDPTEFHCGTCGSEVVLRTETMFTSAYPTGKVRSRRYQCRREVAHDLGPLVVEPFQA